MTQSMSYLQCCVVAPNVLPKKKSVQEMVTDLVTVGSWSHNPQGVLRFIEVGEGISESIVQGNNNSINQNDEGIYENKAEEQQCQTAQAQLERL